MSGKPNVEYYLHVLTQKNKTKQNTVPFYNLGDKTLLIQTDHKATNSPTYLKWYSKAHSIHKPINRRKDLVFATIIPIWLVKNISTASPSI